MSSRHMSHSPAYLMNINETISKISKIVFLSNKFKSNHSILYFLKNNTFSQQYFAKIYYLNEILIYYSYRLVAYPCSRDAWKTHMAEEEDMTGARRVCVNTRRVCGDLG